MNLLLFPWQLVGRTTRIRRRATSFCCLCLRIAQLVSSLFVHLCHNTPLKEHWRAKKAMILKTFLQIGGEF